MTLSALALSASTAIFVAVPALLSVGFPTSVLGAPSPAAPTSSSVTHKAIKVGTTNQLSWGSVAGVPRIPNNAGLSATATTDYPALVRTGLATDGDVPPLEFVASSAPCVLNGGAGDGGSQVPSADNKCWQAVFATAIDARQFGALATAADAAPKVQLAINAACALTGAYGNGAAVFLGHGSFTWKTPLAWTCNGVTLEGEAHGGTSVDLQGSFPASAVTIGTPGSSATNPVRGGVRHVVVLVNAAVTGAIFEVNNGHDISLDDFTIFNEAGAACRFAVWLRGGAAQYEYHVGHFDISGCNAPVSGIGGGISIGDGGSLSVVQEVWLGPGSVASNYHNLEIINAGGVYTVGTVSGLASVSHGVVILPASGQHVISAFLPAMISDSSGGSGYFVSQAGTGYVSGLHGAGIWGSTNGVDGMTISATSPDLVTDVQIESSEFSNNQHNGISIGQNVTMSSFIGNHACNNSQIGAALYYGIYNGGSGNSYNKFVGNTSGDCAKNSLGSNLQAYGFLNDAGTDYIIWSNNIGRGNVSGLFSNGAPGANSIASANVGH